MYCITKSKLYLKSKEFSVFCFSAGLNFYVMQIPVF